MTTSRSRLTTITGRTLYENTVASLIEKYPDLATAGALYVSGQMSLDDFMSEYKRAYDKAYKEQADYIYQKALSDPTTKAKFEKLATEKATEKVSKSQAAQDLENLNREMQQKYGLGNVDLTVRPRVKLDDGSTATVLSQLEYLWQGDEENGSTSGFISHRYFPTARCFPTMP